MKTRYAALLLLAVFLPPSASAVAVRSVTNAHSSSGGVSAGAGETVITGPNKASSQVHTILSGTNDVVQSRVEITTESSGERRTEVYENSGGNDESVDISVESSVPNNARGTLTEPRAKAKVHIQSNTKPTVRKSKPKVPAPSATKKKVVPNVKTNTSVVPSENSSSVAKHLIQMGSAIRNDWSFNAVAPAKKSTDLFDVLRSFVFFTF